jgi:hypothetical protein
VVLVKPLNNLYAPASKRVTVNTGKQKLSIELPPTFGNLRVESDPPGAEILLGGEPTGKQTPHTFKEKAGGRYPVTLRKALYKDATQAVELGGGRDSYVKLTLEPDFGVLEVTSTPPGADILLDGEATGEKTPHTFPARRSGEYEVTVSLPPYYLPDVRKVRLGGGRKTPVAVELDANFGGLEVTSEPAGLSVTIDGKEAGKTPLALAQLAAGAHEVRIASEQYAAPSQRVSIARGGQEKLHFATKPRLGRLSLRAVVVDGESREPAEAEVLLDGKALEDKTPLKKDLLIGSYTLRLLAVEARPRELTVVIQEGEETREEVALEKLLPEEVIVARAEAARRKEQAERERLAVEAEATRASRHRVGSWLVGGGVGAAVLGGVGFVLSRTMMLSSADEATTPSDLDGAVSSGRTVGMGGVALVGAGVVSVLSGLIAHAIAD